jgi:hypothetical protein
VEASTREALLLLAVLILISHKRDELFARATLSHQTALGDFKLDEVR